MASLNRERPQCGEPNRSTCNLGVVVVYVCYRTESVDHIKQPCLGLGTLGVEGRRALRKLIINVVRAAPPLVLALSCALFTISPSNSLLGALGSHFKISFRNTAFYSLRNVLSWWRRVLDGRQPAKSIHQTCPG